MLCANVKQIMENVQRNRNIINQKIVTSSRTQWPHGEGVGLRPLACWDCGFKSHRCIDVLSLVSVVCCQVEVCVLVSTGVPPIVVCLSVIVKPR